MNRRKFFETMLKGSIGLAVAAWLPGRSKQFVDDSDAFIGELVSFDGGELTPVDIVSFSFDSDAFIGELVPFDADGFTINMSGPPLALGDPMGKISAPKRLWLWTKTLA